MKKNVGCIDPFTICANWVFSQHFQWIWYFDPRVLHWNSHFNFDQACVYNIYEGCLLLNKSNNNIYFNGRWKHNSMLKTVTWNLHWKCCTTCGIASMQDLPYHMKITKLRFIVFMYMCFEQLCINFICINVRHVLLKCK
jgi:hypothetical protein